MPRRYPWGFSLVELLVVISIIALLVSLLLPALSSAREAAIAATCRSGARQAAVSLHVYAVDYDGVMPQGSGFTAGPSPNYWWNVLGEAGHDVIGDERVRCPKLKKRAYAAFQSHTTMLPGEFRNDDPLPGYPNRKFHGLRLSQLQRPAEYAHVACVIRTPAVTVFPQGEERAGSAFHTWRRYNAGGAVDLIWLAHQQQTNMVFADGHARGMGEADLPHVGNYSPHPEMGNRGIDAYWGLDGTYVNRYAP